MYVASREIPKLRNFSGRHRFTLWIFASTSEYFRCWRWRVSPKVLQSQWCQDLQKPCSIILRFALANHMYTDSCNWDLSKSGWFSAVYYRIWLEGSQIICFRSFWFPKGQQAFKIKPVNILSRSPRTLIKRTSADMELSNYSKP